MSVIRNQHKWSQIRNYIKARDFDTCQQCGAIGTDVDHIIERRDGGSDDYDNLQLLCNNCHKNKTRNRTQKDSQRVFKSQTTPHDPTSCFLSPTSRSVPLDGFLRQVEP